MLTLGLAFTFGAIGFAYMQSPQFGKAPEGKRLQRIKESPNYQDGQFRNAHATPTFAEGYSLTRAIYEVLIKRNPRKTPVDTIPSVKTDLKSISLDRNVLIWFGHSSYYMQIDGKRILIDPVFSGNASPLAGMTKSFAGSDMYNADDFPEIDYLLITHDHYDHLDYKTILRLKDKVSKVICGLGVGAHFEYWGYDAGQILEKDWDEVIEVGKGFNIHTAKARHGSGRTFRSNNTLWMSYIIDSPSQKIYVGGDSGYDTHFAEIGAQYGPFDLAILENGQYDVAVPYIHMQPEQTLQAATDLQANCLLPVHSSKFVLNRHPWDEPLIRLAKLATESNMPLITPMIGQVVALDDIMQAFVHWWEGLN